MTKVGSSTTASSVICQDRLAITPTVRTRAIVFVTTPARADVKARWAPITSLFSRLTSAPVWVRVRSEEHTSELQSLMRISYAVFCLQKKKQKTKSIINIHNTSTEY